MPVLLNFGVTSAYLETLSAQGLVVTADLLTEFTDII